MQKGTLCVRFVPCLAHRAQSRIPLRRTVKKQSEQSSILTLGGITVVGFLCLSVRIDVPFAMCLTASELCVDILTNLEKTAPSKTKLAKGLPWRVCMCAHSVF